MLTSPVGLRSEKGCAGDAQQKLRSTDPTSHQRGRPFSTNRNCKKNREWEKLVAGPRYQDGLTDRLCDPCRETITEKHLEVLPV
jgi:hypothetical protein